MTNPQSATPDLQSPPDHHPLGPSSLYRRQQCPGSLRLEQDMPETPDTSGIRDHGTQLHEAVANHEMRLDLPINDQRLLAICDAALAPYDNPDWPQWQFEQRLNIFESPFDTEPLLFGTCDFYVVHRHGRQAAMVDFKFGYNPVEAPHANLQLAAYALGVFQMYPDVERVECIICQPTLGDAGVTEPWVFTQPDALLTTICRIRDRCYAAETILKAGDHCRYCRAKSICPEFKRFHGVALRDPQPAIEPSTAADLLTRTKMAERLLDELKARIKAEVEAHGDEYGDLCIVSQPGNRYVSDIHAAWQTLSAYFTADQFMALCDLKPTTVENALVPILIERQEADSIAGAKRLIADLIHMPRGKSKRVLTEKQPTD